MFKKWLSLQEMGGITAPIHDVELTHIPGGWKYSFEVNGHDYVAEFYEVPIIGEDNDILFTRNGINIFFQGPSGTTKPTNFGNPISVYTELIKGIRKMLEMVKPEGLHFYGAVASQDIVYQSFYKKYLSKMFTRISKNDYIRNDILQRWQQTNDPKWQAVSASMSEITDDREKKQKKNADRQKALTILGKIAFHSTFGRSEPIYVKTLAPPKSVVAITYTAQQPEEEKVNISDIEEITPFIRHFRTQIEEMALFGGDGRRSYRFPRRY